MDLNENKKQRIANINYVVGSIALIGSIGGVIYSHKTGGGFWRGVGYWIVGGLALSLPAKVISLPFENKILKEGDSNVILSKTIDAKSDVLISQSSADYIVKKINQLYDDSNRLYGGMTSYSNKIKNDLVEELSKGGYEIIDKKAIKKK